MMKNMSKILLGVILLNTTLHQLYSKGTEIKGIFNYSNVAVTISQLGGGKCPKQGSTTLYPGNETKSKWNIENNAACPTQISGGGRSISLYDRDWKIWDTAGNLVYDKQTGKNLYGQPIRLKSVDLVIAPRNGTFILKFHPHPKESR